MITSFLEHCSMSSKVHCTEMNTTKKIVAKWKPHMYFNCDLCTKNLWCLIHVRKKCELAVKCEKKISKHQRYGQLRKLTLNQQYFHSYKMFAVSFAVKLDKPGPCERNSKWNEETRLNTQNFQLLSNPLSPFSAHDSFCPCQLSLLNWTAVWQIPKARKVAVWNCLYPLFQQQLTSVEAWTRVYTKC